ncbi:hypothetical protein EII17_10540 [Clostridiales bacterium COT073_COT-073]|nr:hypothetical protein EII17_10540 [Clostridiales bacterium COT073_COT-073]
MKIIKKIQIIIVMAAVGLLFSGCGGGYSGWVSHKIKNYQAEYVVDVRQQTTVKEHFVLENKGKAFQVRIRKNNNTSLHSDVSAKSKGAVDIKENDGLYHLSFEPESKEAGGFQEYTIEYQVLTRNDRDYLGNDYYNIILMNAYGNEGVENAEIRIELPKPAKWEKVQLYLQEHEVIVGRRYEERYEEWVEEESDKIKEKRLKPEDKNISWQAEGNILTIQASQIERGQGLRLKIPLGKGFFENNHFYGRAPLYSKLLLIVIAVLALIGVGGAFSELIYVVYTVVGTLGLIGLHFFFTIVTGIYLFADRNTPWAIAVGIFTIPVITYFFSAKLNNRKLKGQEILVGSVAIVVQIIMGTYTLHGCFNNRLLEAVYILVIFAHAAVILIGKRTLTSNKRKKRKAAQKQHQQKQQKPKQKSSQQNHQEYNQINDQPYPAPNDQGYHQANSQPYSAPNDQGYHQANSQPYPAPNDQGYGQHYNRP